MEQEKKLEGQEQPKPEGSGNPTPPLPNPVPSADELQKKNQELETRLKEQDAKLQETQTTLATIEARDRDLKAQKLKDNTDAELQARIKKITENMSIDPEGSAVELNTLLGEVEQRASQKAAQEALRIVEQKSAGEKFFNSVKNNNPEFSDTIVRQVLITANEYAMTGKYKTPDEAIEAATRFVKSELDTYATKKNALPKLPPGAGAEGGGGNKIPPTPPPPKEVSPLEEIEAFNEAKARKSI